MAVSDAKEKDGTRNLVSKELASRMEIGDNGLNGPLAR